MKEKREANNLRDNRTDRGRRSSRAHPICEFSSTWRGLKNVDFAVARSPLTLSALFAARVKADDFPNGGGVSGIG